MSGDTELNPAPPKEDPSGQQYSQLVALIKSLDEEIDKKHDELMSALNELKEAHQSIGRRISYIGSRLLTDEARL